MIKIQKTAGLYALRLLYILGKCVEWRRSGSFPRKELGGALRNTELF